MISGKLGNRLAVGFVVVAVVGSLALAFRGAGTDDDTVLAFLTHLQAEEVELASELIARHTRADFLDTAAAGRFAGMEPFVDISFNNTVTSVGTDGRSSEMIGRITTTSGCESRIHVVLRNGRITYVDITPVCNGRPGARASGAST
ncbi:MAG: hypothetical protein JKY00_06070 [Roseicyclus sp.]|nr:hypothetical protein [Roseicyclus sp.]